MFKARDYNNDGNLDKNGFAAALMEHYFEFKPQETTDLFSMV